MLKVKYNELLARYNKGAEYLAKNPEDDKALEEFNRISDELNNIIQAIPNMTDKEKTEGFVIEETEQVSEQVEEQQIIVKAGERELYTGKTENMNYVVPAPVEQSKPVIEPDNIIETSSGNIVLTPEIVKKYLVNGQGHVTEQEIAMFIGMCKANRLNPFNKEAYLIKYSSEPATMVTSKDIFFKRANQNPNFDGMESGIIVLNNDKQIEKRAGHIYIKGETIVGAWCKVYRKDWSHPIYQEVNMSEYEGRKKSGELNQNWKQKPAVMITKVAEATALRKAFTENLQGMYITEETDNVAVEISAREHPKDILA